MRETLIRNGVVNLKQFGYPKCDTVNILTDAVYKEFFRTILEEWTTHENPQVVAAAQSLLTEIQ